MGETVGAILGSVIGLIIGLAIIIAYSVYALRLGYRMLSYRSAWLDGTGKVNRIVKFTLSFLLGYMVSSFYLGWLLFKFIFVLTVGDAGRK